MWCHDMTNPEPRDSRDRARLPHTASVSPGARSTFHRSESARISLGRGRSRNSLRTPPSPLARVSAPPSPSPSAGSPVHLRPGSSPRPPRGRGRPVSLPTNLGPGYSPPHSNGLKKKVSRLISHYYSGHIFIGTIKYDIVCVSVM